MLLDLFRNDNYITVNTKLVKLFGFEVAIYCSELMNILGKAVKKDKVDNGYIKVDRKYIEEKTTINLDSQIKCDKNLMKLNVVLVDSEDPNRLYVNVEELAKIVTNEDEKTLKSLSKKISKTPKGTKLTRQQLIIQELKEGISCSDETLTNSLRDWVDSVYAKPGGFLSKVAVKTFMDDLMKYTQGDLDVALKIVNIASIRGYKECQWAVNVYEQEKRTVINKPRVTTQQKASVLSDEIF